MQTIVLYGNSLIVSSLGAGLRAQAGLRVLPVDAAAPDAARQVEALQPDLILFDLATVQPVLTPSLWKAHPRVLLVGVDLAHDEMLVISGRHSHAATIKNLMDLINIFAPEPAD